jgi:beta-lactamase regulating signal transducer with metallopeptidase domain
MTSADLLGLLLRATLASSAAILAVMLARGAVRRAFGAQAAYALWLIAPAAALASLLPIRRVVVIAPDAREVSTVAGGSAGAGESLGAAADLAASSAGAWALPLLATSAFWIWAAGALVSLALLIGTHRRLVARLGLHLLGGADRLYQAGSEQMGPALIGVLRPRIVVPADFESRFSPDERSLVLAHERAHLEAFDAQINGLAALALCAGWFNPLFHLARRLLRVDQELACDERVMRRHGDQRRVYAEAMLKSQGPVRPMALGCAWPTGSSSLRERIALLSRPQPSKRRRALGAALAATATLAACVGASAAQPPRVVDAETDAARRAEGFRLAQAFDPKLCTRFNLTCDGTSDAVGDSPARDEAARLGMHLVLALQNGDFERARQFIDEGADVDFFIPGDGTPLVLAARARDHAIAALLLEAGADVNRAAPGDGNPLIVASARGDVAMAELFIAHGADVNANVRGDETPLINAARENQTSVARYLIAQGADVNLAVEAQTWRGSVERRSPLGEATRNQHFEMIRLLRDNGAHD